MVSIWVSLGQAQMALSTNEEQQAPVTTTMMTCLRKDRYILILDYNGFWQREIQTTKRQQPICEDMW